MEDLSLSEARRLALARAGFWEAPRTIETETTPAALNRGRLSKALEAIRRTGYLQLDTVSIAGARSHAIVLFSRVPRLDPAFGEELLRPGAPLFEYWGHEVCWMPLELYPLFEFRRKEFRGRPWWTEVLRAHGKLAREVTARIQGDGPLRSADFEGPGSKGWWDHKPAKRVMEALWSSGDLAIRERRRFVRAYDLAERVIPEDLRRHEMPASESLPRLLLLALHGHGWATTGTLTATWRLRNRPREISDALRTLQDEGRVIPCALVDEDGKRKSGWIRPSDRELAESLRRRRPRGDRGILLSPFDPLLWDRARALQLFGFNQVLEIFKPKPTRVYGYYCLPVLAGERLVARVDLKADRKSGLLHALSLHYEEHNGRRAPSAVDVKATTGAIARFAGTLGLEARHRGRRLPARVEMH